MVQFRFFTSRCQQLSAEVKPLALPINRLFRHKASIAKKSCYCRESFFFNIAESSHRAKVHVNAS